MIKIKRSSENKFRVTQHSFSKLQRRWSSCISWEEVGPVGLEAYLDRRMVDRMDIRAAMSGLLDRNFTIAVFSDKGELRFLL